MAIPAFIKKHLEANNVVYRHHSHAQEFTSPREAEAADETGKTYVKPVLLVADGELLMAAIPANERVDVEKLAQMAGAKSARLAEESEFRDAFPQCEAGATPPLGDLFGVPVWLDASFEQHPTIAFDAGTHTDTVEMGLEDYRRLVRPRVARLTEVGEGSRRRGRTRVTMRNHERRDEIAGLGPFLEHWTSARRDEPAILEHTFHDGSVMRDQDARIIATRLDTRGPGAPRIEITLRDPTSSGRHTTYHLREVRSVTVERDEDAQQEELVLEGERGEKVAIRIGIPAP